MRSLIRVDYCTAAIDASLSPFGLPRGFIISPPVVFPEPGELMINECHDVDILHWNDLFSTGSIIAHGIFLWS